MAKISSRSARSESVAVRTPKVGAARRRPRTKQRIALLLLERSKGTTIEEMQKAVGWQAHSVRGFLSSTVKKMPDVTLVSKKPGTGPRRYRVVPAGPESTP